MKLKVLSIFLQLAFLDVTAFYAFSWELFQKVLMHMCVYAYIFK